MPVAFAVAIRSLTIAPLFAGLLSYTAPIAAASVRSETLQERLLCPRAGHSAESTHEQHNGDLIRWRARWSGDDCSIDLRATGEVKFNADFTDIVSVSNRGSLDITDVDGNTTRRLRLRPDGSGMSRTYSVNGREQPWDDTGRRWLAGLLIELDRISAAGVDYRFPTLYAAGGARAIIDEVEKMSSDYPRGVYLRRLVDSEHLTDAEYQRVVEVAARTMSSDYEMSRLLRSVADHASLDNDAMRTSYLTAVTRMSSDYERSRVLQTIFAKSSISHDVARSAVNAARTFSSDYERSRVLLAAIESKALAVDDVIPVLETVSRSSSDYEKSRVMLAVAEKWTLSGDARKAYLRVADSIRSDYENRRVLAALVRQEAR
jgi:hypothetical protein